MRFNLAAAVLAICVAATAQTMPVEKLRQFLASSIPMVQKGTMSDKELAAYLDKIKLTEKLDERTIEGMQGEMRIGPKTLLALRKLAADSASLPAAAPAAPVVKPRPIAPPTSAEQAAIIDDVREYALNYSNSLPDFICTQLTRRFGAPMSGEWNGAPAGSVLRWELEDTLQIRLSYFEKRESYKVVLLNGVFVNKDYEKVGGAKAFGEFGSMMRQIFQPATQARFEWDHWGFLRGKRVMAFKFHVRLDRSRFQLAVEESKQRVISAYHGLVEVEPDTHAVIRIAQEAENIPADFPMRESGNVLDYDYQKLSGQTFLLPLKSEVIMKTAASASRLEEEFRLYRKYSADSDITFDAEPIAPLPEDKTKETKDPAAPPKH